MKSVNFLITMANTKKLMKTFCFSKKRSTFA